MRDPAARRPLVLAHRGASADAPENTLAAFREAVAQGADGVELDVWRCASGEVVVHHDADARRTAGSPLRVTDATLAELRRLDVGAWKGEQFRGERVPTLSEVLDALPGAIVNVELKSARWPDLRLAGAVARLLRRKGDAGRCLVSSFDPALLAAFRAAAPAVAAGILFAEDQRWRLRQLLGTRLLRAGAVHPQWTLVTPERARAWAERGLEVNAWTVDDPAAIGRLCALGVAALITNRPALAREAVRAASRGAG